MIYTLFSLKEDLYQFQNIKRISSEVIIGFRRLIYQKRMRNSVCFIGYVKYSNISMATRRTMEATAWTNASPVHMPAELLPG